MTSRTEVLCAIEGRYRATARAERSKILDEFIALTGFHRKQAIRLLAHKPSGLRAAARRAARVRHPCRLCLGLSRHGWSALLRMFRGPTLVWGATGKRCGRNDNPSGSRNLGGADASVVRALAVIP